MHLDTTHYVHVKDCQYERENMYTNGFCVYWKCALLKVNTVLRQCDIFLVWLDTE